mgnify:CR=1 FL=1
MHTLSKSFLNQLDKSIKRLPANTDYYAIGDEVITNKSSIFIIDKSYPYRKRRNSIPDAEIIKAAPKDGDVTIFRTKEEAETYASLVAEDYDPNSTHTRPAIFRVQLKEELLTQINHKKVTDKSTGYAEKNQMEFALVAVDKLHIISGSVPGYAKEISISDNGSHNTCTVM